MAKILFADDEARLRSAMHIILTEAGYEVCEARDGMQAVDVFDRVSPDLVILDVMMPRLDGFETCAALRQRSAGVPVLFLSAKGDISDKKVGFHSGADDYLTKPFNPEELVLHVGALLRRAAISKRPPTDDRLRTGGAWEDPVVDAPSVLSIEGLSIDLGRREVIVRGTPISLTPIEFDMLALLGQEPGRVYSRDEIARGVWGEGYGGKDVAIPTHIRHLREKIEVDPASPTLVKTVGRFGYRLGE